jgi:hypothetical protein
MSARRQCAKNRCARCKQERQDCCGVTARTRILKWRFPTQRKVLFFCESTLGASGPEPRR